MAPVPESSPGAVPAADSQHLPGFGNEHASEALPGALPVGQFSPQHVPYGLFAEKFSATAFTAPRAANRRTWFYRIRPSVVQGEFEPMPRGGVRAGPLDARVAPPNQLRWDPFEVPETPQDFLSGLVTLAANGDVRNQFGLAVHLYLANQSMTERYFYDADGELLIVPQTGRLALHTECGVLGVGPGEIALIPRGMKFRVALGDGVARGYVCENYGAPFTLPERGPVGSDGFANGRDFLAPCAAFEDREGAFELVTKFDGHLFRAELNSSPLDVVAWIGTSVPYKYDLARFNTMNMVSYDHPDPSIFTVLTSPSDTPGVANCDFVIFPPRWMVAENTFRPPWYHRNVMSEFMGLVTGAYDAKPLPADGETGGFRPGGASLHNCMSAHGPDAAAYEAAIAGPLAPTRYSETLAFMFESRYPILPTEFALDAPERQRNYLACWQTVQRRFDGRR